MDRRIRLIAVKFSEWEDIALQLILHIVNELHIQRQNNIHFLPL